MTVSAATINDLKSAGHYFSAGALARELGHPNQYGCHFGMRSTLDHARSEFARGWESAK